MALINCTECGRQISDKAESCPGCGNPKSSVLPASPTPQYIPSTKSSSDSSMMKKGCLIVGGVVLLLFGIIANMFGSKILGVSALFIAMLGYVLLKGSNEY